MPQRLWMDEIVSVGLVPKGDSPEAKVTVWKKADTSKVRDDEAASGMVDDKTGGTGRDSKDTAVSLPDLSNVEDADLRQSIEDAFEGLAQERDDLTTKVDSLEAEVDELSPDDDPDPLEKADPVVKAEIERLRKERDEDRERLEDEVAKRRDAEFISKDYVPMLGDPEKMGPVLRKLSDAAPDEFADLETSLKAIREQANLAKVLDEVGTSSGDADPKTKQDAWVEKNRDQFDSEAEARAAFWKTDEGRAIRKEQAAEQRS